MSKLNYTYFDKCLLHLVDLSIDLLSASGRSEFFYHLSEEEVKKESGQQRFGAKFVEGFINHFKAHQVVMVYNDKYRSFKVDLNLLKCTLDLHRFKAVTEALKVNRSQTPKLA